MSDEERDVQQGSEAPSTPAEPTPPRYEIRPVGPGHTHGDEFIDGEPTGERVPLRLYGGEGVNVSAPSNTGPDELAEVRRERDDLRRQFDEAEPFLRAAGKPVMREILNEYVQRGELEPPRGPAHGIEDSAGYRMRVAEPEAEAVMEVMRLHADTLPEYEAQVLNSNPRAFNNAYDKIKATLGDRVNTIRPRSSGLPAAYPNVPMDRRTMETILRSKEVQNARVEPPGGSTPEYPAPELTHEKAFQTARARLDRARQYGTPTQAADAETDLIAAYFDPPKPRRRNTGY